MQSSANNFERRVVLRAVTSTLAYCTGSALPNAYITGTNAHRGHCDDAHLILQCR